MSKERVLIEGVALSYQKRWDADGLRTVTCDGEAVAILERRIVGRSQCYGLLDKAGKTLNEFNTVTDALRWIVSTGMVK